MNELYMEASVWEKELSNWIFTAKRIHVSFKHDVNTKCKIEYNLTRSEVKLKLDIVTYWYDFPEIFLEGNPLQRQQQQILQIRQGDCVL